jgi:DNA-binding MarR family transcriptional regulator
MHSKPTKPSTLPPPTATPAQDAVQLFAEKQSQPAYLIRRAHQISVAIFEDEFADLDLTPIQYSVLLIVGLYSGSDQTTVAGLAAIDKTSCWRAIESLRKRDLVSVALDNKDRRSRVLKLTTAGRRLLDKAVPRSRSVQRRLLEPLDRKQQQAFLEAMQMFVEANNNNSRAPLLLKYVSE